MLRVLALCTLVSLGSAWPDLDRQALDLSNQYSQQVKLVTEAGSLLENVLVQKQYSLLEPDVHYLLLLSLVYYPAYKLAFTLGCERPVPEQLYQEALLLDLPNVLLTPNDTVVKLLNELNLAKKELQPLVDLVDTSCKEESDLVCNKLLQKLLEGGSYPEATKASLLLPSLAEVSSYLVSGEKRLKALASTLNVLPYLVDNSDDGVQLVKSLADLLQLLPHVEPRCN